MRRESRGALSAVSARWGVYVDRRCASVATTTYGILCAEEGGIEKRVDDIVRRRQPVAHIKKWTWLLTAIHAFGRFGALRATGRLDGAGSRLA